MWHHGGGEASNHDRYIPNAAPSARNVAGLAGGALVSRAAPKPPRPNIVVFLSDDMGWDQVGFNGGKEVPTPNIDRIARRA